MKKEIDTYIGKKNTKKIGMLTTNLEKVESENESKQKNQQPRKHTKECLAVKKNK